MYALGMFSTVGLYFICKRANKQKEERRAAYGERDEVDPDMAKSFEELCDFHPAFVYSL